jgi:hypothetical protein
MVEQIPSIVKDSGRTGSRIYFVPKDLWYKYNDPAKVTEDFLKEQKALVEECEKKNKQIEFDITNRSVAVRKEIGQIFGESSKMYKYFKNNVSKEFPKRPDLLQAIENLEANHKKVQENIQKEKTKFEQEQKNQIYLQEAVEFLLARGKNLGNDFTFENAIKTADCIRFDELVNEKIKDHEENGTLFSFGGDDNCENCGGWDGSDRRCECGNRRVGWECSGDFKSMYIYGQAW